MKCIKSTVSRTKEERKKLSAILGKDFSEAVLCEDVMYRITNFNGGKFILPTLDFISANKGGGYYVIDILSARPIPLNKDNFEIICSNGESCKFITPEE